MKPIENKAELQKQIIIALIAGFFVSAPILLFQKNLLISIASFFATVGIAFGYFYFKKSLDESARIRKMESVFPDFLQLMSSNLRAGMTIDRAILMSSIRELAPLDEEILKTGRDLATSKNIERALVDLSARINSEKIKKTVLLIISGIKSGGDLAILLEETSVMMRERDFLEKRAYSNILMYVIFIFLIVSVFAPALFSFSNILVETFTKIFANIPDIQSTSSNLPFTLSKITISTTFIKWFSILFIITLDFMACLVLGLISRGDEKQGLKYFPVIALLSIIVFFVAQVFISQFLSGLL